MVPIAVAATALAAAVVGVSSASTPRARSVTARLVQARSGEVPTGTAVRQGALGTRAFANARVGFALAELRSGAYPAATSDGGRTWKTDGPALHLNAAQAPLSVRFAGVANAHRFYAFGGGQAVDVTSDGGRHWWQAILGDLVIALVPGHNGRLIAVTQAGAGGSKVNTVVYVSRDGGRHWTRRSGFVTG
jgi:hypothetical protein